MTGLIAGTVIAWEETDLRYHLGELVYMLEGEEESPCCTNEQILGNHNAPLVAFVVRDIWRDGRPGRYALPERMNTPAQAVYVGLVSNGQVVAETWAREGTVLEALTTAITQARAQLAPSERDAIDSIEIFLGHSFRRVSPGDYEADIFSSRHRGIRALEISYDGETELFSPLQALRDNTRANAFVRAFATEHGVDQDTVIDRGRFRIFDGEQLRVTLGRRPTGVLMERGNVYIPINAINEDMVRETVRLGIDWLANNIGLDGEMLYGYRPSTLEPMPGNNMIRQWMATVALGRAARIQHDRHFWELTERNLQYNLDSYFHDEDGLGTIYSAGNEDEVKLGAVALAAQAIIEHHNRPRHQAEEEALLATINRLWQPDGSFRTFLRPAERNDNQNFYPGEALLVLATLYARKEDPALLDQIMTSFRYYRDWHLNPENRNPAFIGWHTQAYFAVWQKTRDPALRDFIFGMNDWLLDVQQWGIPYEYRDTMGRFYDPGRPFGPPHASSTGVYLEGLVDAFELARDVGDEARAERYRLAILRGLRSLMQLQFRDELDMFYVPEGFRPYVRGGLRTTVYNNAIRVDNVQHGLMAMMKILQVFRPEDYVYPSDRL